MAMVQGVSQTRTFRNGNMEISVRAEGFSLVVRGDKETCRRAVDGVAQATGMRITEEVPAPMPGQLSVDDFPEVFA